MSGLNAVKIIFLSLLLPLPESAQAEGELIWEKTSNPTPRNDVAYAITVDKTGVYVAGYETPSDNNSQWRIEKRNLTNGKLIWAQTTNPSALSDEAKAISVDSTGVYVAGVETLTHNNSQWRIEKRNLTDGSLIWAQTTNPSALSDEAKAVAVDSTGVYAAGIDASPGDSQWRIEKRDPTTGALIPSFGSDGVVTSNPSLSYDYLYAITVDPTAIYLAGSEYYSKWRIEKRDPTTGALIPSFGSDGVVISDPSPENDVAYAIAVDTSGVYIAGYQRPGPYNNIEWRIEKRDLITGNIIWTQTETLSTNYFDISYAITIDSTGIYVAGYDDVTAGDYTQWRIEKRNLATGSLIWFKTTNSTADSFRWEQPYAVTVDSTGVYVAGIDGSLGNAQWRIEKRPNYRRFNPFLLQWWGSNK